MSDCPFQISYYTKSNRSNHYYKKCIFEYLTLPAMGPDRLEIAFAAIPTNPMPKTLVSPARFRVVTLSPVRGFRWTSRADPRGLWHCTHARGGCNATAAVYVMQAAPRSHQIKSGVRVTRCSVYRVIVPALAAYRDLRGMQVCHVSLRISRAECHLLNLKRFLRNFSFRNGDNERRFFCLRVCEAKLGSATLDMKPGSLVITVQVVTIVITYWKVSGNMYHFLVPTAEDECRQYSQDKQLLDAGSRRLTAPSLAETSLI